MRGLISKILFIVSILAALAVVFVLVVGFQDMKQEMVDARMDPEGVTQEQIEEFRGYGGILAGYLWILLPFLAIPALINTKLSFGLITRFLSKVMVLASILIVIAAIVIGNIDFTRFFLT